MKIIELINESSDQAFVNAIDDWAEMVNSKRAVRIILKSPQSEPFRIPPKGLKYIYRGVVRSKETPVMLGANHGVMTFATTAEGAVNFILSLETDHPWIIISKKFNPANFLLDYTSMISEYNLIGERDENEFEIWMKVTPELTIINKNEIFLTSEKYYDGDSKVKSKIYSPAELVKLAYSKNNDVAFEAIDNPKFPFSAVPKLLYDFSWSPGHKSDEILNHIIKKPNCPTSLLQRAINNNDEDLIRAVVIHPKCTVAMLINIARRPALSDDYRDKRSAAEIRTIAKKRLAINGSDK